MRIQWFADSKGRHRSCWMIWDRQHCGDHTNFVWEYGKGISYPPDPAREN